VLTPQDLPLLAVFTSVIRLGSFTAAARELGLSKSVVSHHVATLEERCGVRLVERTTRTLRLTQVGERVMEAAATVLSGVREVERAVEEHRDVAAGTLRVASTHDLGVRILAPAAARLAVAHPALRVDLHCDDGMHDLVAEGFDVALRLGATVDSSHIMKKFGSEPEIIVGSPALAERFKHAMRPSGLVGAPWVGHTRIATTSIQRFRSEQGDRDEIHSERRALANTGDGVRALAAGSVGLATMPLFMVKADIEAGRLVRVCPEWFVRQLTLFALLPSSENIPARVRAFLVILHEVCAESGFKVGAE
jgi:DNA-binding transcriptional LysR family regulator